MAKDEDEGVDAPRRIWEEAIDEVRGKYGKSVDDDTPEERKEKKKIIDWLIDGYKQRFGNPYPDKV